MPRKLHLSKHPGLKSVHDLNFRLGINLYTIQEYIAVAVLFPRTFDDNKEWILGVSLTNPGSHNASKTSLE